MPHQYSSAPGRLNLNRAGATRLQFVHRLPMDQPGILQHDILDSSSGPDRELLRRRTPNGAVPSELETGTGGDAAPAVKGQSRPQLRGSYHPVRWDALLHGQHGPSEHDLPYAEGLHVTPAREADDAR